MLLFGLLRRDKGVRDLLEAAAGVEGVHVILAGEDRGGLEEAADLLADPRLQAATLLIEGFLPDEQVSRRVRRRRRGGAPLSAGERERGAAARLRVRAARRVLPGRGPPGVRQGREHRMALPRHRSGARSARACARCAPRGRAECRARGESARRFAHERLGWDVIARRTGDLYREVLGAPSAAR